MLPRSLFAAAVALGALALAGLAQSRTWVVAASGGGDFTDLPPALEAARDGDTIRLRTGTYTGGSTSKALGILGDAGAGIRLPGSGAALAIRALSAGQTFVLAGVRAVRADTEVFPVQFLLVRDCMGRVHLDRVVANLLAPLYTSQPVHVPVTVTSSRHVTLQDCTLEGSPGLFATDSTVVLGACKAQGQSGHDDPRVGRRMPGAGVHCVRCDVVLSEPQLTGGNGMWKWLVGGYWPSEPGLDATDTMVTLAGSGQSRLTAGGGTDVPMPAIDGTGGGVERDPRVVLAPHYGAPAIAASIPDQVRSLPRLVAKGAPPGGKLELELLASNGDLAHIYVSLPAHAWSVPGWGRAWVDLPTLILLGRFSVPASDIVALSLPVPNEAGLTGLPIVAQALVGSAAGILLSTPATIVID